MELINQGQWEVQRMQITDKSSAAYKILDGKSEGKKPEI